MVQCKLYNEMQAKLELNICVIGHTIVCHKSAVATSGLTILPHWFNRLSVTKMYQTSQKRFPKFSCDDTV